MNAQFNRQHPPSEAAAQRAERFASRVDLSRWWTSSGRRLGLAIWVSDDWVRVRR